MSEKRTATDSTVTRGVLTAVAQAKLGFSRRESKVLIDDMLDILSEFLVSEGEAKISSFGKFQVRNKRAREGRNPKTGERVPIAPRKVVSFRPSSVVRARIRASLPPPPSSPPSVRTQEESRVARSRP